ncbi:MAG: hypothetical protein CMJ25_29585 [Phycisphaerae bacterium]|nr:hypothetical protein [Phycisphaerae bacterium]
MLKHRLGELKKHMLNVWLGKIPERHRVRIMITRIKDTKLLLLTEEMTDKELKKKVVKGMPLNALYLITKTKYFKHG